MSLCIGIDPAVPKHPFFMNYAQEQGQLAFCKEWSRALLKVAQKGKFPVKIQSAFFEQHGREGFGFIEELVREAQKLGVKVILDWKRGDIASTMAAYGDAAGNYFKAPWMTAHMSMGVDIFEGLDSYFRNQGGVYFVWAGSNPSSRKIFSWQLQNQMTFGEALLKEFQSEAVKRKLVDQVGYVLGATNITAEMVSLVKKHVDAKTSFLMPGVGAQGATVSGLLRDFLKEFPASLVPISRGITEVPISENLKSWTDVEQKFAQNVAEQYKAFL